MTEERDLLTVAETARLLGIGVGAVNKRLKAGHLAGVKVSARLWLISRAEAERAARAGRLKPGPRPAKGREGTRLPRPPRSLPRLSEPGMGICGTGEGDGEGRDRQ